MNQGLGNGKYEITRIKGGTGNCYLIANDRKAVLFDTASGKSVSKVIEACSRTPIL